LALDPGPDPRSYRRLAARSPDEQFSLFFFSAIFTDFSTAFPSRLLMSALGAFAAKSPDGCKSDGAAIRRGASLPVLGEGASAQVCHPSAYRTAFENPQLHL
jgi:hypothetical protein